MEGNSSRFGSRFGVVMVVAGSAVGLGNIWRFPYVAGENGGAAFILIYLLISLFITIPVMLSEFVIGRRTHSNPVQAFRKLSPGGLWHLFGYLGLLVGLLILFFYCVISGWTLSFIWKSLTGQFSGITTQELSAGFDSFINSWWPVMWALLFVTLNSVIVGKGVTRGIERCGKTMMPLLFVLLLLLSVNSFFLPGFGQAVDFLFHPDISKITWKVVLEALGQSFFSMSVGMGAMITYGSYIKDSENLYAVSGTVAVADVAIAMLAGLAIFPAVFTFGIEPTSGSNLVFITLPSLFSRMGGGVILSALFFILLFFASTTSSISLMEPFVAFVTERFGISRRRAVMINSVTVCAGSVLCCLSCRDGSSLHLAGKTLFDFFDYITSNFMMPVGGLAIVIFVGWFLSRTVLRDQLTTFGKYGNGALYGVTRFLIMFLVPLAILALMISLNVRF